MQGASDKECAAIYRSQFGQLMRWCFLMALLCLMALIFLVTATAPITSVSDYVQVGLLELKACHENILIANC